MKSVGSIAALSLLFMMKVMVWHLFEWHFIRLGVHWLFPFLFLFCWNLQIGYLPSVVVLFSLQPHRDGGVFLGWYEVLNPVEWTSCVLQQLVTTRYILYDKLTCFLTYCLRDMHSLTCGLFLEHICCSICEKFYTKFSSSCWEWVCSKLEPEKSESFHSSFLETGV